MDINGEGQIDLCCCCGIEMPDRKDHCYMNFRYQVPGRGLPEQVLVAVVCPKCAKDSDDPALFPVVELLINTKIIRIENPDLMFTPK